MNKPKHLYLRLLIPLILFIMGCPPPNRPPEFVLPPAEEPPTGLTVMGEAFYLAPASTGNFLVQVKNPYSGEPDADARVKVLLGAPGAASTEVFNGKTDKAGVLQVQFTVPEESKDPAQVLTVIADTARGEVQRQEEVHVGRVFNVLVSTDKPVYQPGQTIHVRALALDTLNLRAAQEQPLVVTVQDPQGNKLMRRELTTSQYGIASADFILDSQAASGDYIITSEMGPVASSRSVEVKPYSLPRFEITFGSDKDFYLPGEQASGEVSAQYFFGKPVAGGQVSIKGFVTDVDRVQVFELSGETDAEGVYRYEFQVPDYFVGQLDNDTADVDLEISVSDVADHAESVDDSVTVAEKLLLVNAVPESGFLRPGLENIVYIDVSYPNGAAAQADLTIGSDLGEASVTRTDENGLASITLEPTTEGDVTLNVSATDADGNQVEQTLVLGAEAAATNVLMRPDKAEYQVGDVLNLDILVAGPATTAYLDIIKDRQTFGLAPLPVEEGVARAAIDLDGSLLGTLELNVYVITDKGEIVRDRRYVLVNPAPAEVQVAADAEVYAPGDTATLDIAVQRDGAPMPGAVGIAIVDESVFSVEDQDPGFARTYFLLERELQEPRYEIHDFAPLHDGDYSPYDDDPDSLRTANAPSGVRNAELARGGSSSDKALFGFFGEELAAVQRQELAAASTQLAVNNSQFSIPRSSLAWGWINRIPLVLPLLGFAFYDGSRRRRNFLIALTAICLSSFIFVSCAAPLGSPAAPAAEMAAPAEAPAAADETTATRGQAQAPRLRQFFPETLYWMPEVETDDQGRVQIDVPIADSITTWRVSVLASDQDGNLGSAELGLRVFQDFFVEPDLPRFLTVGDELEVPVSVFNYLDEPQEISLTVAKDDWFELVAEPDLTFEIGANEVAAAYVPIRVTDFGLHDFQITANGSAMSDAVLRQVDVVPDGKSQAVVENGRLEAEQTFSVRVPDAAVPGTARVTVKLYPGVVSQVIDGLEGMLQQPYGCFEQTSSTTYPNVLVLDYLKTTGQASPGIQLRAEQYISLGYQRLLTFEVAGFSGGFSLFGDPPPQTMLTAYGIMEFTDMSQVAYVDPQLLERTATFLFERQNANGSWEPEGMTIESGIERMGEGNLPASAYITWGLADAGYADSEAVQNAAAYILAETAALSSQAGGSGSPNPSSGSQPVSSQPAPLLDAYTLSLAANALVAANADARAVLDALLAQAQPGPDDTMFWTTGMSTWLDSYGDAANIETTALVASALLRSNYRLDVAQQAIDYLIGRRDSYGGFYTTQATVLTLKALLLAAEMGGEGGDASITVSLNGERSQTIAIGDDNADVVQQISFDDVSEDNELAITLEGDRAVQYQVITEYYLPWSAVESEPEAEQSMRVDVHYDRTELEVNDMVGVQAEVELLAPGVAGTVLVDLGVPPGFSPVTQDLDALVENETIDRYELTGRQILVYMTNVPSGQVHTLDYRLQARFPITAQTPGSQVYDYYTPDQKDVDAPQRIVVRLGTPGQ